MKVILSCTDNPLYSFFIPLAIYSWKKIGVDAICFVPGEPSERMELALATGKTVSPETRYPFLNIEPDREVTYFQCSRLFGAALDLDDDEYLITSDIDMAVFGNVFNQGFKEGFVIYGPDLVPQGQFPICYIMAQARHWRKAFNINKERENWLLKGPSAYLGELLDHIQCDNMRGNYWAKDQEHAYDRINGSGIPLFRFNRSNGKNQFATQRLDRDGWIPNSGIIDAHLLRPGYLSENFGRIKDMFHAMYPEDDLTWMVEYHEKFLKLL